MVRVTVCLRRSPIFHLLAPSIALTIAYLALLLRNLNHIGDVLHLGLELGLCGLINEVFMGLHLTLELLMLRSIKFPCKISFGVFYVSEADCALYILAEHL